ncbi:hypothetical protein ACT9DO_004739 [Salmonella enterica subsp. enterica serovar Catumagos]|nr:hypothetical protein [Salmonella enterica]EAS1886605.1 hypothetical protein [Salmonella enterica]ECI6492945.1 hypothetical protein [Salmonella enterica subsp. enterica]
MVLNEIQLLCVLKHTFNDNNAYNITYDNMDLHDRKIIYEFFKDKSWQELVEKLDLKKSAYPMELATYYFNEKNFKYYIPLYIYASFLNKNGWVFDSCFIDRYLSPDNQDMEYFLSLFENFSNSQLNVISQYIHYASFNIGYISAQTAFENFWGLFYDPTIKNESIIQDKN